MKTNAARKSNLAIIHPASTSRIERAARELDQVTEQIKVLTEQKVAINARLLQMTKREGEPDEKGKIRYETDLHKFIVVQGTNHYTSGDKVKQALVSMGVKLSTAVKAVKKGTSTTDYEYVRTYAKGEEKGDD